MLRKIPNILTIGRILIVPFFVLAFYLPGFYGDLTALILFVVASFTDFLDGMLARLLGEESKLGELLDPIADKIIVATALILLVMDGTIRDYEVSKWISNYASEKQFSISAKGIEMLNEFLGADISKIVNELDKLQMILGEKAAISEEDIEKNIAQGIPMRRVGEAEDLEGLITFLASEKANYMTGLAIQVDG